MFDKTNPYIHISNSNYASTSDILLPSNCKFIRDITLTAIQDRIQY